MKRTPFDVMRERAEELAAERDALKTEVAQLQKVNGQLYEGMIDLTRLLVGTACRKCTEAWRRAHILIGTAKGAE